jgi:hypothetical protein
MVCLRVSVTRRLATPGSRKRLPVTLSDMPLRSRYGVIPPRLGWPSGAGEHAQVDVLWFGDHAFVQHEPGFLREGGEHPLADLLG